ncbi:AcrR family transcriptional regulator [Altererythrobacter atlanticus]|uniref:HTH-type transcriptional regulator YttP n=1 Tax=Croceibacterium atlanticum TaxID=1267766 RepID=A0A0F7KV19_9SPHN|nr:CerR family C-terminal domain-containing protein [Croceibacterium atlanticum]AKH44198.1 putative HTH-type transcriptional regulator YttP [Croceibacterium atlanticum]MBB5732509.1 AcrR family transcriptional regulator [Croceibacterium atlanticum]
MVKSRLMDVAVAHFGRRGFEGASTRDIATAADTAMSSITYHFGGKEGLYLACADHIAAQIRERQTEAFALFLDAMSLTPDEAIERVLLVGDSMAVMMLDPASADWARIVVREQQDPTEAFDRLWRGVMEDLMLGVQALLSRICPNHSRIELRALAILLFGQVMVMRSARASVCKALEVEELGQEQAARLRDRLRRNILAILNAEKTR